METDTRNLDDCSSRLEDYKFQSTAEMCPQVKSEMEHNMGAGSRTTQEEAEIFSWNEDERIDIKEESCVSDEMSQPVKTEFKLDADETTVSLQEGRYKTLKQGDHPGVCYQCDICNKTFSTQDDAKKHLTVHAVTERFKCDVCNRTFARRSALRRHYTSYNGSHFTCDVCNKTFRTESSLTVHRRKHSGGVFKCDLCNKILFSVHEGQCFECGVCKKTFHKKSNFNLHMRIHDTK